MPKFDNLPATVHVLDPGAGSGMLTAAVVSRLRQERQDLRIVITAVEMDQTLIPPLTETLEECAAEGGIEFRIVNSDYLEASTGLMANEALLGPFDLVVMNPPYGKLPATASGRIGVAQRLVDTPNLYAAFWALGVAALAPGGQCVAIVPRSWANGTYFQPFRRWLLGHLTLDTLHTFESRSTVFADTGVLQENVIVSGTRGDTQGSSVTLSTSFGHEDQQSYTTVPMSTVVHPQDRHSFVRFSVTPVAIPEAASYSLAQVGLGVSTGRVVDFRVRELLATDTTTPGAVPLLYPGNVRGGIIDWPLPLGKPQGFLPVDETAQRLLVPEGTYTVVKRFSAKEERRRLVAAVWDGQGPTAFENHLNYFHDQGRGLFPALAFGLSAWLNTSFVDQLFRTFSGHTQVNAGDLRVLPYPSRDDLIEIGRVLGTALPTQDALDEAVRAILTAQAAA